LTPLLPQEGFYAAYRTGLGEWNGAKQGGELPVSEDTGGTSGTRALYPMKDSWSLYQPVSVPGAADNLPDMPQETDIARRFEAEIRKLRR
jgi:hypothetical protein